MITGRHTPPQEPLSEASFKVLRANHVLYESAAGPVCMECTHPVDLHGNMHRVAFPCLVARLLEFIDA